MSDLKFCKDCKYYKENSPYEAKCKKFPYIAGEVNIVTGKDTRYTNYYMCSLLRTKEYSQCECGKSGKSWEPAVAKEPVWKKLYGMFFSNA